MPRKTIKNLEQLPVRHRRPHSRTVKNTTYLPVKKRYNSSINRNPIISNLIVKTEEPDSIYVVESVQIFENPKISTSGSPVPVEKPVSSPREVIEQIENAIKKTKDTDKYRVFFTEKHRSFFANSKDRIFSNRTSFETAIVRFNISFASEIKIPNPKTEKDFDEFIKKTPERVLSVPEGECCVVVGGTRLGDVHSEKIIHAVMVYNKNGTYYIFNPNDDASTYNDGFYYCYNSDNKVFQRPLSNRKTDLHKNIKGGACFVISYAMKLLCEKMNFPQFMKLVKTKSLYEIMEKCFVEMEN